MAWPPKRRTAPGRAFETEVERVAQVYAAIERPEPFSAPSSVGAKTIVGRLTFSLRREATRPTTPSLKRPS